MTRRRGRFGLAVAAVASAALLVGAWYSIGRTQPGGNASEADFVVALNGISGGGEQGGLVELRAAGPRRTIVAVEVFEPTGADISEVRVGNCDLLDGSAAYGLESVVKGRSETTLDVPLSLFRRTGYSVVVRRPTPGLSGALCGDLARSQPPGAAPVFD